MISALNIHPSTKPNVQKNIYKSALFSFFDKNVIWNNLKEERLLRQKNKEMNKTILANKKVYYIHNKKYYKLVGMYGDYYLQANSLRKLSVSPFLIELYRYTFIGMQAKIGLMKVDKSTNNIFISEDTLRVDFKSYEFEAISS